MALKLHVGHDVHFFLAALGKHLKRKREIPSRKVTISLPPFCKTRVITAHNFLFISDAIKCVYLTRDFPRAERCLCCSLLSPTAVPHFLGKTSEGCQQGETVCISVCTDLQMHLHTHVCLSVTPSSLPETLT